MHNLHRKTNGTHLFLAKGMAIRDTYNGKANVPDIDKSYEEVLAWRDDPSGEIKPKITMKL